MIIHFYGKILSLVGKTGKQLPVLRNFLMACFEVRLVSSIPKTLILMINYFYVTSEENGKIFYYTEKLHNNLFGSFVLVSSIPEILVLMINHFFISSNTFYSQGNSSIEPYIFSFLQILYLEAILDLNLKTVLCFNNCSFHVLEKYFTTLT